MIVLLIACGPKIEPLAPMRKAIDQARSAGPDEAPHARFVLAKSTAQDLVLDFINPEPIVMPVMLGTVASISIKLQRPSLETEFSSQCKCTKALVDGRGTVSVDVAGLLGKQTLAKDVGFSAKLHGGPLFAVEDRAVVMRGAKRESWTVDLELDEEKGFLTNDLVDNQFEGPVAKAIGKDVTLVRFPDTMPVMPAKLALEVADDPTLGIWLEAEVGAAPPPIEVDEGWGVSLSSTSAAAVLRAVIAKWEQHKRYHVEPLTVAMTGKDFAATLRVHRVASKVQYRDYDIRGVLRENEDGYVIAADTVEEIAKVGWKGSLIGGVVTAQVRKQIRKLQQTTLPRTFTTKDKRFPTTWTIETVDGTDDGIFVYGSLETRKP